MPDALPVPPPEQHPPVDPQKRVLIVMPTYNEKENLPGILPLIFQHVPTAEVLVVDDSSPDGTGEWVDAFCKTEPRVHVLHRKVKDGLGRAYVAGFEWALARDYTHIMQMDADFSHDPASIPALLAASDTYDLVIGSRFKDGRLSIVNWPLFRLMLSLGAVTYVRVITGMKMWDMTTGFKVVRREILEAIGLDEIRSNGYAFQIELNYRAAMLGFSIGEERIIFADRTAGQSKLSRRIAIESFFIVPKLRWYELTHAGYLRKRRRELGH